MSMWQTILDKLHKTFVINWMTGVPGGLTVLCGSADFIKMIPEAWQDKHHALCFMLLAFGVIGAKAQNVSNAKEPVAPQIVSAVNEAKANTANE